MFKKLGGFDEKFFAYLEDVDFFLRLSASRRIAQDKSFGIAYDIEVLHNHMTTSVTMGNFKARQDMINWWRLYFKHPEKFRFNLGFIIERLRNVSGYIKASLKK
jgi:GT2 family glycosyltransferase